MSCVLYTKAVAHLPCVRLPRLSCENIRLPARARKPRLGLFQFSCIGRLWCHGIAERRGSIFWL